MGFLLKIFDQKNGIFGQKINFWSKFLVTKKKSLVKKFHFWSKKIDFSQKIVG